MNINKIYEEDFTQLVLKSKKPVLVDFYADWCTPCKMVSPILTELEKENPDFVFYKVNVDENPNLADNYGISAIPAILVFKNGKSVETLIGLNSKQSTQELIDKAR